MHPVSCDRHYAHLLEGVSFLPIFIVGDHRSGTTLLYQMLSSTQGFHFLSAYHVIHYREIVANHVQGRTDVVKQALAQRFAALGMSDRRIDDVVVSPDLPEEYGFVIEDRPRPQLCSANLSRFAQMCRKLKLIGGAEKPILLKSPWDALNFIYLKQSFPEAKFIFIHRHPLAVIDSQLRAIRSMLESRNEYAALIAPWYSKLTRSRMRLAAARMIFSPRLPLGQRIALRHVSRVTGYFLQNVGKLPKADYFSLRYEDLCSDPRVTMEAALRFLQVPSEVPVAWENWIRRPKAGGRPAPVPQTEYILRRLQPYLRDLGYASAEQAVASPSRR